MGAFFNALEASNAVAVRLSRMNTAKRTQLGTKIATVTACAFGDL